MHPARFATLWVCCTSLTTAACVGDDSNPALPPTDAAAAVPDATTGDVQVGPVDAEPPPLPIALVRVANWSPDAPGVDFCIAAHGTSVFTGPLLGRQSVALDASTLPLAYPLVSAYVQVPPGQYDVRAVVAGAADCATGIGVDLTSAPALAIGTFATFALVGRAHGSGGMAKLQLAAFLDEGVASGKKLALRFINATTALGAADFGTGTAGASFKPIFTGATFGASGSIPDAGGADGAITGDPHGYALLSALASATVSAHATGTTTDAVVARGVAIAAGAAVTAALLDSTTVTEDGGPTYQLLECVDNAGTVGLAGSCALMAQ
jgi:hypothetical protein